METHELDGVIARIYSPEKTIIQKLDQSKMQNVTPGKANNLDEFFKMIIRPQFEKKAVRLDLRRVGITPNQSWRHQSGAI